MPHRANTALLFTVCLSAAAGLAGCAGDGALTGRKILDDLERARVPAPDTTGRAPEAAADLPASGPVSLADLLTVAEARNPELAAARSGVGVAAGQRWQASLYPNPRADVSVEDVSWRNGAGDVKTTVGFTQPIVLGNRRHAAVDAASAEEAARVAEVEARRRAVFGDIAAEHARLVAVREQERLYGELRDLANRTLAGAQTRFEARAAPELDVIRPRVELYRIEASLARLAQERMACARALGLLVGGVDVDAARLTGELPPVPGALDIAALESTVRATHPALAVADREIDAATATLARVDAERAPDLDVRVAAGHRGESDDGIVEFGVGMTLPLWDTRQGDILSSRFEVMRARQRRAAIENDLLGRLSEAAGAYAAARAQLDTFRDRIVPDAQRAFDQVGEGYRGGRSSFLDLLDAQRTLTEARVALVDLARAVAAARARVIQVVGPDGLGEGPDVPPQPPVLPVESIPAERPQGAEVKP
ncbi:MAG: TolC family protein [Phycisphaerae bacterium]|nr:TolC family protein [Phycisphaerae bacterium]